MNLNEIFLILYLIFNIIIMSGGLILAYIMLNRNKKKTGIIILVGVILMMTFLAVLAGTATSSMDSSTTTEITDITITENGTLLYTEADTGVSNTLREYRIQYSDKSDILLQQDDYTIQYRVFPFLKGEKTKYTLILPIGTK